MKLADSHCHLDDVQFVADIEAVMERALAAGIGKLLAIGTGDGPPDLEAAIRQAEKWPFVYATVGVHPNDAPKADDRTFDHLESLCRHRKVRAVGEIGLDYHWGVPKEAQVSVFIQQLSLASANGMPVIIHTRDAWDDTLEILETRWAPTRLPCVMHCFTGDAQQAERCLALGFTLAFGGVTTFPKSTAIREAARLTPVDRLLLETDAPYLAPVPYRGKRNEPAYLAATARVIAEVKGIDADELASTTLVNFERMFEGGGDREQSLDNDRSVAEQPVKE